MKKIWITGGGSGIGKALAIQLARAGHTVYVSGRDLAKLKTVRTNTYPIACNICDEDQVKATVEEIGPLDLAILNAGTYNPGSTHETSLADFRKAMEVNYFGTLNCLDALLPDMKERGGHIAVVASLAGYRGLPNSSGYGPSKAAMISLCESMRAELQDSKVKFQLINPGFVESPLTDKNDFDMPHLITPKQAALDIFHGLESDAFEIAFPKPFVRQMKFLRLLPYKFYFPLIKKVTKQ